MRFPLKVKGIEKRAILHGSEAWCLKENEMNFSYKG